MKIKIGTGNRVCFPKLFCNDNNINLGDEYELEYNNGIILLKPVQDRLGSDNIYIDVKDDVVDKKTEIEQPDVNQDGVIISDDNQEINIQNLPKNFKELSSIPLSGSEEFKPNLLESTKYYQRRYSKCGLICRTKTKYVNQYCERCKGQLLDESVRSKYCPYTDQINESYTSNDSVDITEDKVEEDLKKISENDTKNVIYNIKKNIATLNNNLEKEIEDLKESISDNMKDLRNKDVVKVKKKPNEISTNLEEICDTTLIEPVKYQHHHQCYECEEFFDTGFMLSNDHFYCKRCASELFKNYMKERGKLKNV